MDTNKRRVCAFRVFHGEYQVPVEYETHVSQFGLGVFTQPTTLHSAGYRQVNTVRQGKDAASIDRGVPKGKILLWSS